MTCARCLVSFATRADHAAHLIEVHGLAGGVALVEARIPPGEFAAFSAAILAHPTPILPSQADAYIMTLRPQKPARPYCTGSARTAVSRRKA